MASPRGRGGPGGGFGGGYGGRPVGPAPPISGGGGYGSGGRPSSLGAILGIRSGANAGDADVKA